MTQLGEGKELFQKKQKSILGEGSVNFKLLWCLMGTNGSIFVEKNSKVEVYLTPMLINAPTSSGGRLIARHSDNTKEMEMT